jgi:hypothetical protein
MLQKLKVTSYVFIYFLMFGFSFIALQVTSEEVEAAGVCEPIEVIRNMKDTAQDSDYKLWTNRCKVSGQNGNCGDAATHWPQGDSGRCETTTADTVAAQDNIGVCEPIEVIRNMKDTAQDSDYKLWTNRCKVSGQNGNCGDAATHWPQGDSGRCETTTADTVAAQDVHSTVAPVNVADQNNSGAVCHPSDGIIERYNTELHESYEYSVGRCAPEGVTADTCATGWGKGRCQWGIPPELEPLKNAIVKKSQGIADCKKAVAVTWDAVRQCMHEHLASRGATRMTRGRTWGHCFVESAGVRGPGRMMASFTICARASGITSGNINKCSREAELAALASCK